MSDQFNIQPGTIFAGDFRVVRSLNAGGMGAVYAAEQISTGKPRALKVMLSQLIADASLRKRFEQEARIASLIESEHIVEVVGAGVDGPSGLPWLAMELLSGEDLSELVTRRGPLPVADVLAIFEQLCHAVGAAHRVGVVHRDLKPENIFLAQARRAGASFMVKVLDFGIAKIIAEASTRQTAAIGSPIWMAPEQADQRAIAPSTDVWALGLIAFYLLTGRPYWKSANDEHATMPQVLKEVLFEPIVLASVRTAELGCSLPPGFDPWFAACVAREPTARFSDATQAGLALAAALRGDGRDAYAPTAAVPIPGAGALPSPFAPTPSALHGTSPPFPPPGHVTANGTAHAGMGAPLPGALGGTGGVGGAASYTIGASAGGPAHGFAPPPPAVPKGLVALVVMGALAVGSVIAGGVWWMTRSTHATVAAVTRPADTSATPPMAPDPKHVSDDAKPDASAGTPPASPSSAVATNDAPATHDSHRLAYTPQRTPLSPAPSNPSTPVVTPPPASVPNPPTPTAVPPPAPPGKTLADLASSSSSADWWTARRILEPRVLAGTASTDDLHLLNQICSHQHDKQRQRTVKNALAGKH